MYRYAFVIVEVLVLVILLICQVKSCAKRYQEDKSFDLKLPLFQDGPLTPEAEAKWRRWMKIGVERNRTNILKLSTISPAGQKQTSPTYPKTEALRPNFHENVTDSLINTLKFFNDTAQLILQNVPENLTVNVTNVNTNDPPWLRNNVQNSAHLRLPKLRYPYRIFENNFNATVLKRKPVLKNAVSRKILDENDDVDFDIESVVSPKVIKRKSRKNDKLYSFENVTMSDSNNGTERFSGQIKFATFNNRTKGKIFRNFQNTSKSFGIQLISTTTVSPWPEDLNVTENTITEYADEQVRLKYNVSIPVIKNVTVLLRKSVNTVRPDNSKSKYGTRKVSNRHSSTKQSNVNKVSSRSSNVSNLTTDNQEVSDRHRKQNSRNDTAKSVSTKTQRKKTKTRGPPITPVNRTVFLTNIIKSSSTNKRNKTSTHKSTTKTNVTTKPRTKLKTKTTTTEKPTTTTKLATTTAKPTKTTTKSTTTRKLTTTTKSTTTTKPTTTAKPTKATKSTTTTKPTTSTRVTTTTKPTTTTRLFTTASPSSNGRTFWPVATVRDINTTAESTTTLSNNSSSTEQSRHQTFKGNKPCQQSGKDCLFNNSCCSNYCKVRRGRSGVCSEPVNPQDNQSSDVAKDGRNKV